MLSILAAKSGIVQEIKVNVGSNISYGKLLGITEDSKSSSSTKIKAKTSGEITEILIEKGQFVDKGQTLFRIKSTCTHSTIMKDMCADCGVDLRKEDPATGEILNATSCASFAMVHSIPELKVSSNEALSLGIEDEKRLLKTRKLVLLVDLDQTVIHTTNDEIVMTSRCTDIHHFQLSGPYSPWYHTKVRPLTKKFLESISKYFELHICTFGARLYAHTVAGFLDPDRKFFSHRILSRDECFDNRSKTANLSALFPCGDHMVCIIDDREDVWNFARNLVHVKPYHYFKNTGDINAPPEMRKTENDEDEEKTKKKQKDESEKSSSKSIDMPKLDEDSSQNECFSLISDDLELSDEEENSCEKKYINSKKKNTKKSRKSTKDKEKENKIYDLDSEDDDDDDDEKKEKTLHDDTDDYLLYLEEILKTIHKAYYDLYDQSKTEKMPQIPDLKTVIPYVKRKALKDCSIVFSGLIPTSKNTKLEQSKPYLVAKSLGARVTKFLEHPGTTHLIAARLGTAKVNESKKIPGVFLVTPDWLWSCAERWEHVDERLFPLSKSSSVTLKPPAHCSSPEIAFAERCGGSSSSELPEANNPYLTFSSEDLKGMDKEIDDILSDTSSSDSDEEEEEKNEFSYSENEPSVDRSSRKRKNETEYQGSNTSNTDNSKEDNDDDGGWKLLAAELEREFFGEADSLSNDPN